MSILIFTPFVSIATFCCSEQTAFNYFAKSILEKEYSKNNKIYFSGKSEAMERLKGLFAECYPSDEFINFYRPHKDVESKKIAIDYSGFPMIKKSTALKRNGLNIQIYRTVKGPKYLYTYISVYKINGYVNHYLLKMSPDNTEVLDVCRVNETI